MEEPEKYPLLVRVYGALGIVAGCVQVVAFVMAALAVFDCWYKRASETMDYEHQTAIEEFCNESYDDEFMENRFQSMTMNADNASRAN